MKIETLLLAAAIAWGPLSHAAGPGGEPGRREVVLVPAGEVNSEIVEDLATHLPDVLLLPVRVTGPVEWPLGTVPAPELDRAEALAKRAAEAAGEQAKRILVVTGAPIPGSEGQPAWGLWLPEHRTVILSLAGLLDAPRAPGVPESTVALRPRKIAAHMLGRSLGMPPCPNWLCALHDFHVSEELDHIAWQFCPPCSGRMEVHAPTAPPGESPGDGGRQPATRTVSP